MQFLEAISKRQNDLCSFPRQTIQYQSTPSQVPTSNAKEVEIDQFYEALLEKEMATPSSTLAWKIPWVEETGRLQSMGSQRVRHD